ncbi:MAG TPA: NADH-quinone oxidoreductase subunit NuoH [Thermodesulfobacteriaceae bacterium]|nr:NADH-quinone oxidoreductase subunit NuoH [Thermodesulfobacteriaceae bacterium]
MVIEILLTILLIVVVFSVIMLHVAYATYFERKVIGHMQVRMGPMRVGPHGLLQPIADGIKLFFKEDVFPETADKPTFYAAPIICLVAALTSIAVIPFWEGMAISDINIGLLFILAMSSLAGWGVVLAGWASNSKYAFLGGLRASAQIISYEIAMGLSIVGVMMMAGSLNMSEIVKAQAQSPFGIYAIPQVLGFFVFLVAMLAETNRTPFDMPECESELVAGYCTEYAGFRFALFFLGEYVGMIVMASVGTICFLGGWTGPFEVPFFPIIWFMLKVYFLIFFFYWVRATLPRYRYDQIMALGWKVLIPLALGNVILTGIMKTFVWH